MDVEFREPEFRRVWTEAEGEAVETEKEVEGETDPEGIHDDSGNSLLFEQQPSTTASLQRRSDWLRSQK